MRPSAVIPALAVSLALGGVFAATGTAASGPVKVHEGTFALSASPSSQTIPASGTATYFVTIAFGPNTNAGSIRLKVTGLPGTHVTASFSPNPVGTDYATLTITSANARASSGSTLEITGRSSTLKGRSATATTSVTLTVS